VLRVRVSPSQRQIIVVSLTRVVLELAIWHTLSVHSVVALLYFGHSDGTTAHVLSALRDVC